MTKRFKLVLTYEYDVNLEDYENVSSIEELAELHGNKDYAREFFDYVLQNPNEYSLNLTVID